MSDSSVFTRIRKLVRPYLSTRHNDVHTTISTQFAYRLLSAEGGQERIVIPAILMHDIGWSKVPEVLQIKAFGPKATMPELMHRHESEGVKIAAEILDELNYDAGETAQILQIIGGHDTRKKAISLDDQIVKDADKLWRYSRKGFQIDVERFGESYEQGLNRLHKNWPACFFTYTARKLAWQELRKREREAGND